MMMGYGVKPQEPIEREAYLKPEFDALAGCIVLTRYTQLKNLKEMATPLLQLGLCHFISTGFLYLSAQGIVAFFDLRIKIGNHVARLCFHRIEKNFVERVCGIVVLKFSVLQGFLAGGY